MRKGFDNTRNSKLTSVLKSLHEAKDWSWLQLGLDQALEEIAEQEQDGKPAKWPGYYRASLLSHECDMFILLTRACTEKSKIGAFTQRRFDVGWDAHFRYAKYFRQMGVLLGVEVEPTTPVAERVLSCHGDAVLLSPWGKKVLIELKTIHPAQFSKLSAPKPDHARQWNITAHCLQLQTGAILYEDISNLKRLIFPMELDRELVQQQVLRAKAIEQAYQTVTLVKGIWPDTACERCDYKMQCPERSTR